MSTTSFSAQQPSTEVGSIKIVDISSEMSTLSEEEAGIIHRNPINDGLDYFRKEFKSSFMAVDLNDFQEIVRSMSSQVATYHTRMLLFHLFSCRAAVLLPSRHSSQQLTDDILTFQQRIPSGGLSVEAAAVLLEKVVKSAPDHDIWSVVYDVVTPTTRSPSKTSPSIRFEPISRSINRLHDDWNAEFYGSAPDALKEQINIGESGATNLYAKIIPIIQSSGTGKSRLVDELSKDFLTISFVFRSNAATGYPPGDPEVTRFTAIDKTYTLCHIHSITVCLLASALSEVDEWLANVQASPEQNLPDGKAIAMEWHKRMAPTRVSQEFSENSNIPEIIAHTRSADRKDFCARTVTRAEKLLELFKCDKEWKGLFPEKEKLNLLVDPDPLWTSIDLDNPMDQRHRYFRGLGGSMGSMSSEPDPAYEKMIYHPLIIEHLLGPTVNLLGRFKEKTRALFVFDEAAYLVKKNTRIDCTFYLALRRVLGLLTRYPIWALFLSTESNIEHFAQATFADSSSRIRDGVLARVVPFCGLQMDIEMNKRYNNKSLRAVEMRKPLSQFSTAEHMAMYGRPLWLVYKNSPTLLRHMAICKLLDVHDGSKYDPRNQNHVFAAIASRVCLDPCTNSVESVDLTQDAVNSHLRLVLGIDNITGTTTTTTLPEPIISEAVAAHLQTGEAGNWTKSIATLFKRLLHPGLIEKGMKGELYVRLVFVLARDKLLQPGNVPKTFPYAVEYKVIDFLKTLFNSQHHQTLLGAVVKGVGSRNMKRAESVGPRLGEVFENAFLNFSYFTHTDENLKPGNTIPLLHGLMHAQAALQFSYNQPIWDLAIPIYFGDPESPFDSSCLSAMLIQVKNRKKRQRFSLLASEYTPYFPKDFPQPVLSILLELGTDEEPNIQPVESFSPNVYGFHVTGAGSGIFGCLAQGNGKLEKACLPLLDWPKEDTRTIQDKICNYNVRFRKHNFEERYPKLGRDSMSEMGTDSSEDTEEGQEMDIDS